MLKKYIANWLWIRYVHPRFVLNSLTILCIQIEICSYIKIALWLYFVNREGSAGSTRSTRLQNCFWISDPLSVHFPHFKFTIHPQSVSHIHSKLTIYTKKYHKLTIDSFTSSQIIVSLSILNHLRIIYKYQDVTWNKRVFFSNSSLISRSLIIMLIINLNWFQIRCYSAIAIVNSQ